MADEIKVPFVNLPAQYLALRAELLATVDEVLSSGTYILGEHVNRFEENFAHYCQVKHAIAVANATDALWLVLKALGVGPGHEVITAPNSFIASAGAIAAVDATPVFVDVGADYNLNPALLEQVISKKTKVIMPVHLTGRAADMDAINEIAAKHDLYVVEDAAQAVGARYKTKRVGGLGIAACFSLHPLKNLHLYGDGGIITTNDKTLANDLRQLRNHGLENRDACARWGYNSRLDSLQAALGVVKLRHLESWTARFQEIAQFYRQGLQGKVSLPPEDVEQESVYHNFVIRLADRDALMAYLMSKGIETKVHYPIPIHLQKPAAQYGYKIGDFPESEAQCKSVLSLPIYPELRDEQVALVIAEISLFLAQAQRAPL